MVEWGHKWNHLSYGDQFQLVGKQLKMESGCCIVVDVELSNMKATVYMVQTLKIQTNLSCQIGPMLHHLHVSDSQNRMPSYILCLPVLSDLAI